MGCNYFRQFRYWERSSKQKHRLLRWIENFVMQWHHSWRWLLFLPMTCKKYHWWFYGLPRGIPFVWKSLWSSMLPVCSISSCLRPVLMLACYPWWAFVNLIQELYTELLSNFSFFAGYLHNSSFNSATGFRRWFWTSGKWVIWSSRILLYLKTWAILPFEKPDRGLVMPLSTCSASANRQHFKWGHSFGSSSRWFLDVAYPGKSIPGNLNFNSQQN